MLDDKGEHLLSLASRFSSTPNDAYAALSTADVKHPTIALSIGRARHAHLRPISRDPRDQPPSGRIARAPSPRFTQYSMRT